jgi:hypothetical protein
MDDKQRKRGNIKTPSTLQGSGRRKALGQNTPSVDMAMFGSNTSGGTKVVYSTDLSPGQDDSVSNFTSDISWQSKDKRIRVEGYFTK